MVNRDKKIIKSLLNEGLVKHMSVTYKNELKTYLNYNTLNEDETPLTFEWDIAKEKINKSKEHIKTSKDANEYLKWFLESVKNIPQLLKIKLIKYVVGGLLFITPLNNIINIISTNEPELVHHFKNNNIKKIVNKSDSEVDSKVDNKKEIKKLVTPTSVSNKLIDFIKYEEGSPREKGEPMLKAYTIGDGMVTIGWGHAERLNKSNYKKGDKITYQKAEELLNKDINEAKSGLDRLLKRWDKQNIKYEINQGMYDAMVSMIYNMGIGNFLSSDFIQLVKKGEYKDSATKILTTNVTYKGHINRRKKESEMFLNNY